MPLANLKLLRALLKFGSANRGFAIALLLLLAQCRAMILLISPLSLTPLKPL